MKKKITASILTLSILLCTSACNSITIEKSKKNIPNKDTLNISESEGIISNVDRENSTNSELNLSLDESTSVDLNNFNINSKDTSRGIWVGISETKDSAKFFFDKFDGIHTIRSIDLKENEKITVDYSNELEGGKLSVVILDSEYNILYTLNANEKGSIELDGSLSENYIIKALGEEAISGTCTFRVE